MGTLDRLIADLKTAENQRLLLKELRKEIRKPVPVVRKMIRARAIATLPRSGGLGVWVASSRISATFKASGRTAGVQLKGGRNSAGGRSDIRSIDRRGRLRHPSWGRRGRGQWHTQFVTAGFFSDPAAETTEWRRAAEVAIANTVIAIARG